MIWMIATFINANTMQPEYIARSPSDEKTVQLCEADIDHANQLVDPAVATKGQISFTKVDGTKLYIKMSCEEDK